MMSLLLTSCAPHYPTPHRLLDRRVYLGNFDKEELAACAYDLAARELFDGKAKVNFVDEEKPYSDLSLEQRNKGFDRLKPILEVRKRRRRH